MIVSSLTQRNCYALKLAVLLLFLNINTLSALDITWIGGTSNWNIAANWDLGTIPTAADHVIINTGRVAVPTGFTAEATSIDLQGGDIWVKTGSSLLLADATDHASANIDGRILVDGYLEIINSVITFGMPNSGKAIFMNGKVIIGTSGHLYIDDADYFGIQIEAAGKFINRGVMTLSNVGDAGILNFNIFNNKGTIDVTAGILSNEYAIVNYSRFNNYASGVINSSGGGTANISNTNGGICKNWGEIYIDNASIKGIFNSGEFYNYADGLVDIFNSGSSCIYNLAGGNYYNYGKTEIVLAGSEALLNGGTIYNYDLFNLIGTVDGYRDFAGATIQNEGTMYFQSSGNNSIILNGTINNTIAGNCLIYEEVIVNPGGSLLNYGYITSTYDLLHTKFAGGIMENYGAINDINGSFSSIVDNFELYVSPLTNPLQNGVAYPNALDVVALSNFTVGSWITEIGGPVAGTYDSALNEFTPNVEAIGITSMRISVNNNVTGAGISFTLNLSAPVLPMVAPPVIHTSSDYELREAITNNADLEIFPNPNAGALQLQGALLTEQPATIFIYNSLGQLVLEKKVEVAERVALQLPQHWPNGKYELQCVNDQQQITKSILLLR